MRKSGGEKLLFNNNVNSLTKEEQIKISIDEFNSSIERRLMLKGESYYKAENDVLDRNILRYENNIPVVDDAKSNNKLSHAFMHTLVDEKVNYLLIKPFTLKCDDKSYLKVIQDTLGKRFQKKLFQLGVECSNKGIAWLHIYINSEGEFKQIKIPSEQVIPLWDDNDHEKLQALIRYYNIEVYEGKEKEVITKVEYWTSEKVEYFLMQNEKIVIDADRYLDTENNYEGHFAVQGIATSWESVPFIPFKNNDFELPDLKFVKSLVDNYDITRSDIANLLEEIKNIIYILKGYDGEDLGEFVRNLAYYHGIKLDADENVGVEKIENNLNVDAAEKHYQQLKRDIYHFGQGADKYSDKLGDCPSGLALKFMYSGLDLKCNAMEDNFRWAFEQLMYFVNKYLEITAQAVAADEISIIFNRDITTNESQVITDCKNSKGVISDKTIIANHPWVVNFDGEMSQIEEEK